MTGDPLYKYDLFLRYHRAQSRWVRQLAERLDREGFRLWFDQWMLQPGDDRRLELRRAIDECQWIGLVLSPEFVANPWPKDELYSGFPHAPSSQNQRLLPLIVASCDLPGPVRNLDFVDFCGSEDDPILFEYQALQLMARLDPSLKPPQDLQRFRLNFQRTQVIEDEQLSGWQTFVRSIQGLILNVTGGESRSKPLTKEETQQVFFLQWVQQFFQWNTADLQFDRGEQFWLQAKWEEALAAYDRALNIDPNFALAWGRRGDTLVKLGRYGEAVNSYNGSLNLNPYDEGMRLRLAIIQGRLKQYKAAVISYDKVLEMDPDNSIVWHNRGIRLAQLGRPTLALKSLETSLTVESRFLPSYVAQAYVLHTLKRYGAALPSYERALKSSARRWQSAQIWRRYALALLKARRPQAALASFNRALKLAPQDHKAWHNRGILLLQLERYRSAIQCFDRAFSGDPDNAKTWHARGLAFQALGLWSEATVHFEEALKTKPQFFPAGYALAVALLTTERFLEASQQFGRLVQERPRNFACLYGQVRAQRQIRKWKGATTTARRMTEINPRDPLGWFALAMIATDQQDYDNAVLYFSQVLAINSRDSTTWNNRAWVLCDLGRLSEALEDIHQAIDLQPKNAAYWHTQSRIQAAMGHDDPARESWQQALSLDPSLASAVIDIVVPAPAIPVDAEVAPG